MRFTKHTRTTALAFAVGFAVISRAANADPQFYSGTLTVSGKCDPWLAGMPDGTVDYSYSSDSAPAQSPFLVPGLDLSQSKVLTFSASGLVSMYPDPLTWGPDGQTEAVTTHGAGAVNGISNITAPYCALLGVFLTDTQPDSFSPPSTLLFDSDAERNYSVLSPDLRQVFFIGDGKDGNGAIQSIIVPVGATRLFLGMMDSAQWNDNGGSFSVQIQGTPVPEPASTTLLALGAAGLLIRRRRP